MSQPENITTSLELTGTTSTSGANAGNMASSTVPTLIYTRGSTTNTDPQQNDETVINAVELVAASGAAGVEDNVTKTGQASLIEAEQQPDGAAGHQTKEPCTTGQEISRQRSDEANKIATIRTASSLPQCNSYGFDGNHVVEDLVCGQQAIDNNSCPTIQGDMDITNYIDIQDQNVQVFDENVTPLQLQEWLLCKVCNVRSSAVVIGPCQHFCLCQRCLDTVSICPTCGSDIVYMNYAQVQFFSLCLADLSG